jgi:RNA polymerase sigma factor (sigma-70 family)
MRVPEAITVLDARPGCEWTSAEFARVAAWWREREQEKLVWYCIARFLGKQAKREDVEEIWQDFYLKIIPRARASYRPVGVGFCTYLLDVCLKNHCLQQSLRLARRHRREILSTDAQAVALVLESEQNADQAAIDPFAQASQQAFLAALTAALNHSSVRPVFREAFLLRHTELLSYPDIARSLGVPEGTAKAWVHRATARIAALLREQGWEE